MRRTWQIGPFQADDGQLYPISDEERDREMISLGWLIDRMGGSLVVAPLRVKNGEEFTTAGLAIKYDSGNVPAIDVPRGERAPVEEPPVPEPPAEPEPEPEPVPEPALAAEAA